MNKYKNNVADLKTKYIQNKTRFLPFEFLGEILTKGNHRHVNIYYPIVLECISVDFAPSDGWIMYINRCKKDTWRFH